VLHHPQRYPAYSVDCSKYGHIIIKRLSCALTAMQHVLHIALLSQITIHRRLHKNWCGSCWRTDGDLALPQGRQNQTRLQCSLQGGRSGELVDSISLLLVILRYSYYPFSYIRALVEYYIFAVLESPHLRLPLTFVCAKTEVSNSHTYLLPFLTRYIAIDYLGEYIRLPLTFVCAKTELLII
jgi:hypothetical protein